MKAEGERAAAERERARVEAKKVGRGGERGGGGEYDSVEGWPATGRCPDYDPHIFSFLFPPSQHEQLPEMATFEEFKKTERRAPPSTSGGDRHRGGGEASRPPSSSSRGPQQQPPGAGSSGGGLSGEALVSEYVKRHLGPHLKEKAITREQYDKIREK